MLVLNPELNPEFVGDLALNSRETITLGMMVLLNHHLRMLDLFVQGVLSKSKFICQCFFVFEVVLLSFAH